MNYSRVHRGQYKESVIHDPVVFGSGSHDHPNIQQMYYKRIGGSVTLKQG